MKTRQSLPPVSLDEVAASISRIQAMPQAEKETLCEEFFNRQPNLLAQVLLLHKLDVPIEKVDGHPEINAFAYANGTLHEAGIYDSRNKADVYCIRAVRNLVDALARARRE